MKTIVEPKQHIDKLWGKQRIKEEAAYRLMRYVLRVDHDGKVLLHNVVTGQLVALDPDEAEALEKLPMQYEPVMEQLVTEHYLVPDDFDEYKTVKQLRRILQSRSTGSFINHFVILPTTFCNARCFYCYESDYPRVHMTEETAEKIVEYIDEHREGKDITIQWFGGEPLVGIDRIDQISRGLRARGVNFVSSMISNGFLFTEESIDRSVDLWNLKRIQITLDGTEEVYNRVKAYVGTWDSPFQRVLRNIDLLSQKGIRVNIRLNVDYYNKDDIRQLIEELIDRYSDNRNVSAYVNMLFNDQGYEPVHHSLDEMIALTDILSEYIEKLKSSRMAYEDLKPLSLQTGQCMADNPHSVLIQPDGSFCRCEHESVNESYGNLVDGVVYAQQLEKWKETVEHSDACPTCSLFPACYQLRYCMNSDLPCTQKLQMSNIDKQTKRIIQYVNRLEADNT